MADSESTNYSIVEYYGGYEGYRCGYCRSSDTNYSHGMWAHTMSVQDYQDLIDRGWRRSGQYVYKPTMQATCCPMYTIRCSILDFTPTKSQKKLLKRVHRFLTYGDVKLEKCDELSQSSDMESDTAFNSVNDIPDLKEKAERAAINAGKAVVKSSILVQDSANETVENQNKTVIDDSSSCDNKRAPSTTTVLRYDLPSEGSSNTSKPVTFETGTKKQNKQGDGPDANRPLCKKAKLLRLEKKKQKLQNKGLSGEELKSCLKQKTAPAKKAVEEFIFGPMPANPAHRLETVLVASGSPEMKRSLHVSSALFAKYQMAVHKETADECNLETYLEFLVSTPLKHERRGPPSGYGSFHQQYWLDNKLIAVGVIDVLPKCVSSVYFFYDPDFGHLSLGTYGSLRETAFARSLHAQAPDLLYYYMGFYIDTCPKMRYKARLKPSYLLCPEVYSWHPIENALLKLKESKYSRLNDDKNATDPNGRVSIDMIQVLFHNTLMTYSSYWSMQSARIVSEPDDVAELTEYASLVGKKCAQKLILVRS